MLVFECSVPRLTILFCHPEPRRSGQMQDYSRAMRYANELKHPSFICHPEVLEGDRCRIEIFWLF